MAISFPPDLTLRAVTRDDLQALTELVRAWELADVGQTATLPADIEDMWEDTNLATNAFALVTSTGQLVGYTAVSPDDEYIRLDVHTCVHPSQRQRGLEHALLALAEERAHQLIAEADKQIPALIRGWTFSAPQRELFVQEGYQITSNEVNLGILLDHEPDAPQSLQGITVRPYQPGQDERAIHAVIQESFQDIGGHPYRMFEEWSERATSHSHFDPAQTYVALDGAQVVGAIHCRTYTGEDYEGDQEGHITQLGVLRPWRKRGIARHLMQRVFAAYYQRGIQHIMITVDAHNPTGARQLYEAMGMREYEQVSNVLKLLA
jgi:mycothiol synthase